MSKNDGGPAFPVIGAPGAPEDYSGMTLRDYFAAKALQGFLACPETPDLKLSDMAQHAYKIADAMLAERDK